MKRKKVPSEIAAKVLFQSDRTCCVCRIPGKHIQIHHIDGNRNNNNISNLAVLCVECHTETQTRGRFHRKLNAEQIILYRDDWYKMVARERASVELRDEEGSSNDLFFRRVTTEADVFMEKEEYGLLAILYHVIGNKELRDKYIEMAIEKGIPDDFHILLREFQDKVELISKDVIQRTISKASKNNDWHRLARIHEVLQNYEEAVKFGCKAVAENIEKGNIFFAAFCLKELANKKLHLALFEEDYKRRIKDEDIWWQLRCLQELGWHDQIVDLFVKNKSKVEESEDIMLKEFMYFYLEDEENYLKAVREHAEKTHLFFPE